MITVALADDEPLFTAGLAMILDAQPDMGVLWQAIDGADALRQHRREVPDVLLCDIQMPGMDGLAATEALVAGGTSTRIIILTTFEDDDSVLTAIERGAAGFLLKNTPPDELLAAIRTVHDGNAVISPGPTRRLFATYRTVAGVNGTHQVTMSEARRAATLTPREREVLALVAHGLSNQEICDRLWLSMPTVKTHIGNLIAKTGARDRVQLVLFALRAGIAALG
ncbi:MAG: response regulator transcription factor [Propioniciclava sp.]|uniref:response regulator n=1 Tax=Propioniciclava sp. TaxID=2038686 RepID=UPI0039E36698